MHNKKMYQLYKNLIKASLNLIIESLKRDRVVFLLKDDMIYHYSKNIKTLDEFNICADFLADYLIRNANTDLSNNEILLYRIKKFHLHAITLKHLKELDSLKFNEKNFNRLYAEFETYFCVKEPNFVSITELENFELKKNYLDFGNGLKIRKNDSKSLFRSGNYVIELTYDAKLGQAYAKQIFNDLISALRLFKSGKPGFNSIETKSLSWQTRYGSEVNYEVISGTSIMPKRPMAIFLGNKYILTQKECIKFKKFWMFFKEQKSIREDLRIAIERFNNALEREKPEDKLIDFMIALESLLLKEKAELGYRLSIRTAVLLGGENEKENIFNNMKKAYNLRSDIVHGINEMPTEKILDMTKEIEDYSRQAINEFIKLRRQKKHNEIIESIDKKIFN